MSLKPEVLKHRALIREIALSCNVSGLALVGSVARGEDTEDSDCDFLADYTDQTTLFDVIRLEDKLETLLERPVELISRRALHPRMIHLLDDAIAL